MSDKKFQRFFESHGFAADAPSNDELLHAFDAQMDAGLAGRKSSLAMIPAYVATEKPVPVNSPVLVMDAGGTNLRVAVVWFDAKGKARIEDFRKYPMPGTEGVELDAATFFDTLATHLAPIATRSVSLGLCFSYPTEITPDCDGRLLRWTKQIKAEQVVGRMVGASLLDAVRAKTGRALQVRVLNDTVATLLAGRSVGVSRRYAGYIGFILGTGTNTAYVERHERIAKVPGLPAGGHMAINVESGNFDGVPQSDFDRALDASLPDCGAYRFEKMISGAYLGSLARQVFRHAAKDGLFSDAAATALLGLDELKNKDFDDFVDNPFLRGTAFDAVPLTDEDRRAVISLGTPILLRAARFAAVNIAAAILRSGAGHDPLHPVCATVDGSTYYRTRSAQFKSRIEQHLRELLHPRGVHYDVIAVEDAPMIGAAVAGLTA